MISFWLHLRIKFNVCRIISCAHSICVLIKALAKSSSMNGKSSSLQYKAYFIKKNHHDQSADPQFWQIMHLTIYIQFNGWWFWKCKCCISVFEGVFHFNFLIMHVSACNVIHIHAFDCFGQWFYNVLIWMIALMRQKKLHWWEHDMSFVSFKDGFIWGGGSLFRITACDNHVIWWYHSLTLDVVDIREKVFCPWA